MRIISNVNKADLPNHIMMGYKERNKANGDASLEQSQKQVSKEKSKNDREQEDQQSMTSLIAPTNVSSFLRIIETTLQSPGRVLTEQTDWVTASMTATPLPQRQGQRQEEKAIEARIYTTDILEKLTYFQKMCLGRPALCYVCRPLTSHSLSQQLNTIFVLRNKLRIDVACFITKHPNYPEHSYNIFGAIVNNTLLIIDPTGEVQNHHFNRYLQIFAKRHSLQAIYMSKTPLKRDRKTEVASDIIVIELIRHIATMPAEDLIAQLTKPEIAKSTPDPSKNARFHFIDLSDSTLLPRSLQQLLIAIEPKAYQAQLDEMRQAQRTLVQKRSRPFDLTERDLLNDLLRSKYLLEDVKKDKRFQLLQSTIRTIWENREFEARRLMRVVLPPPRPLYEPDPTLDEQATAEGKSSPIDFRTTGSAPIIFPTRSDSSALRVFTHVEKGSYSLPIKIQVKKIPNTVHIEIQELPEEDLAFLQNKILPELNDDELCYAYCVEQDAEQTFYIIDDEQDLKIVDEHLQQQTGKWCKLERDTFTEIELKEWQQQAEGDEPEAQFQLGYHHAMGIVLEQNTKEAVTCYQQAAAKYHAQALVWLGYHHMVGWGTPLNVDEGIRCWQSACQRGDRLAFTLCLYFGLGRMADPTRALLFLQRFANEGHLLAQFIVIRSHLTGVHEECNEVSAFKLCLSLADRGFAGAEWQAGVLYSELDPPDTQRALIYIIKAATHQLCDAAYELGKHCETGKYYKNGIDRNKAKEYYEQAAKLGHEQAQTKWEQAQLSQQMLERVGADPLAKFLNNSSQALTLYEGARWSLQVIPETQISKQLLAIQERHSTTVIQSKPWLKHCEAAIQSYHGEELAIFLGFGKWVLRERLQQWLEWDLKYSSSIQQSKLDPKSLQLTIPQTESPPGSSDLLAEQAELALINVLLQLIEAYQQCRQDRHVLKRYNEQAHVLEKDRKAERIFWSDEASVDLNHLYEALLQQGSEAYLTQSKIFWKKWIARGFDPKTVSGGLHNSLLTVEELPEFNRLVNLFIDRYITEQLTEFEQILRVNTFGPLLHAKMTQASLQSSPKSDEKQAGRAIEVPVPQSDQKRQAIATDSQPTSVVIQPEPEQIQVHYYLPRMFHQHQLWRQQAQQANEKISSLQKQDGKEELDLNQLCVSLNTRKQELQKSLKKTETMSEQINYVLALLDSANAPLQDLDSALGSLLRRITVEYPPLAYCATALNQARSHYIDQDRYVKKAQSLVKQYAQHLLQPTPTREYKPYAIANFVAWLVSLNCSAEDIINAEGESLLQIAFASFQATAQEPKTKLKKRRQLLPVIKLLFERGATGMRLDTDRQQAYEKTGFSFCIPLEELKENPELGLQRLELAQSLVHWLRVNTPLQWHVQQLLKVVLVEKRKEKLEKRKQIDYHDPNVTKDTIERLQIIDRLIEALAVAVQQSQDGILVGTIRFFVDEDKKDKAKNILKNKQKNWPELDLNNEKEKKKDLLWSGLNKIYTQYNNGAIVAAHSGPAVRKWVADYAPQYITDADRENAKQAEQEQPRQSPLLITESEHVYDYTQHEQKTDTAPVGLRTIAAGTDREMEVFSINNPSASSRSPVTQGGTPFWTGPRSPRSPQNRTNAANAVTAFDIIISTTPSIP